MPINTNIQPRPMTIPGTPEIKGFYDLRGRFTLPGPWPASHRRPLDEIIEDIIHHDGSLLVPGDRDHNGTTMDEDVERIDADCRWFWQHQREIGEPINPERPPYHLWVSPNGPRVYLCLDPTITGAHAGGHNRHSLGFVLLGNFVTRTPPLTQVAAAGGAVAASYRGLQRKVPISPHSRHLGQSTVCPGPLWPQWGPFVEYVARKYAGF